MLFDFKLNINYNPAMVLSKTIGSTGVFNLGCPAT
jgi:hypothetical protein